MQFLLLSLTDVRKQVFLLFEGSLLFLKLVLHAFEVVFVLLGERFHLALYGGEFGHCRENFHVVEVAEFLCRDAHVDKKEGKEDDCFFHSL